MKYVETMPYKQGQKWSDVVDTYMSEARTPEHPLVIMNPLGHTPLSALMVFDTEEEESFDITLRDAQNRVYLSFKTLPRVFHPLALPIALGGAVVEGEGNQGSRFSYTFGAQTLSNVPELAFEGQLPENNLLLVAAADGEGPALGVNAYGELSWLCTESLSHAIKPIGKGRFLCGAPGQLAPPNSGVAIWEMDLLGFVYKEYRFEDGFIGDFALLDEEIVAISQAAWQGTLRDSLVWLNRDNGEMTKRLDLKTILPPIGGSGGQSGSDWFQGASLRYCKEENALYLSGLAQNLVVVVDAITAEVTNLIGDVSQLGEKAVALCKTPLHKGTLEEAYGVTKNDGALYYVNAHRYPKGERKPSQPYEVCKLDTTTDKGQTFLDNDKGLVSPILCDLGFYGENVLVLAGGASNSNSVVPGVLALKRQNDLKLEAHVMLYHEKERRAHLKAATNLAAAALFAPTGQDSIQKQCHIYGQWAPSFEVDIDLPVADEGQLEDEMTIEFWQDDTRLYLSGSFFKGEACVLILRKGEEKHQYFLVTNRKPFGAEWIYTYAGGIERQLNWAIPVDHLKGEWTIDILIDDTLLHSKEVLKR